MRLTLSYNGGIQSERVLYSPVVAESPNPSLRLLLLPAKAR